MTWNEQCTFQYVCTVTLTCNCFRSHCVSLSGVACMLYQRVMCGNTVTLIVDRHQRRVQTFWEAVSLNWKIAVPLNQLLEKIQPDADQMIRPVYGRPEMSLNLSAIQVEFRYCCKRWYSTCCMLARSHSALQNRHKQVSFGVQWFEKEAERKREQWLSDIDNEWERGSLV